MSKILITGIFGSGASYLAEELLKNNLNEVYGLARWHSNGHDKNIQNIKNEIKILECDLTDFSSILRALKKIQPTHIYNMASHANVKASFENPIAVLDNNIKCTINLFEAIRILEIDPIVQHVSTSEVYGLVKEKDCPITEEHPLNPANIYSVSKLTQEKIASSYYYSYGIKTIITRCFAYICPRREDIFSSAFAKQVVEIEKGKRNILTHGNLNSIRTLMDVRDMSSAYIEANNKCKYGEPYNIGGTAVLTVGKFLEKLKEKAKVEIKTQQDPKLLRPVDVTCQICSTEKFYEQTGWKPKFSLEESIDFLLEYYRKIV